MPLRNSQGAQLPKPTLETFGECELADLPARTADILRMLSGIDPPPNGGRWTLAAVAAEFDLSVSRIGAIRGDGLKRIREARERQRGLR